MVQTKLFLDLYLANNLIFLILILILQQIRSFHVQKIIFYNSFLQKQ